jgi:hypothetical protein
MPPRAAALSETRRRRPHSLRTRFSLWLVGRVGLVDPVRTDVTSLLYPTYLTHSTYLTYLTNLAYLTYPHVSASSCLLRRR